MLIALFLAITAGAQEITGTIVGTVKDPAGAVVPNATISVFNTDKNVLIRTVKSDATGDFVAPLLPIGHYTLAATASGFKKVIQKDIMLNLGDKLTINVILQIGAAGTEVTVEANALQVEQQSATAAGLISGTQVRELSLNNRNYEQLVALQPGVSYGGGDQLYVGVMNPNGDDNSVAFSINGARDNSNNWTIDGADNVDRGSNATLLNYPSVDSIAEFKVLRGEYNAEFGRSAGGQINVVTKSGENKFHGSVYEFFRNDVLNANNYFNNLEGLHRPPLRYNNFGWTLGGPIVIPGKYNKERNKSFFFYSQEFRRVIMSATSDAGTVPTSQEKKGIFTHDVCVGAVDNEGVCDPAGILKAGTAITTVAPIDSVANAYIKDIFSKIPDPQNLAEHQLFSPMRNIYNFRQETLKFDHVFNEKLTATFRYLNDSIPTEEPAGLWTGMNVPGVATTSTNAPGRNIMGRITATFSPTFLLEAGYAYSYGAIVSTPIGLIAQKNSPDIVPLITLPQGAKITLGRVPSLNFSGGDSWTGFGKYDDFNRNHNWFTNLTKILGHHTIKWGFTFNKYNKNENAAGDNGGTFEFSSNGAPDGTQEFEQAWAWFLLGKVSRFNMATKDLVADIHQNQFEAFVQDEWRVRPNFTVSYGVRYSLFRQPTDGQGTLTNFDPYLYSSAKAPGFDPEGNIDPTASPNYDWLNGIIIGGNDPTYGHRSPYGNAVTSQTARNFAPRIGFAWDPFGKGKTSLRAGYGVFFDSPTVGYVEDNAWANPPYVQSLVYTNGTLSNPVSGIREVSMAPVSLRINGVDWHLPYTQQWSLDIQHELARNLMFDIGYYGNKGTHLLGGIDLNQVKPGVAQAAGLIGSGSEFPNGLPDSDAGLLNPLRPYKGYSFMNSVEPWFRSNYHSLQMSLQKRFSGSNLIGVNYTWSRTMTDSPGDRWNAPQNSYNIHANYGPSDLDRRQMLNVNFVYELPFMKAQNGFAGKVLGGWQLSGIIAYNSGRPFTVTTADTIDRAGLGLFAGSWASVYPDMTCNPNGGASRNIGQWFNTACFNDVPDGQLRPGNERRNSVYGPGFGRWDLSVFKNTKMSERVNLQFRLEAFNVWNHTNWSSVDSTYSTAEGNTFGQVTSARDPRLVQLGLKLSF
jgi:hypothetical protein